VKLRRVPLSWLVQVCLEKGKFLLLDKSIQGWLNRNWLFFLRQHLINFWLKPNIWIVIKQPNRYTLIAALAVDKKGLFRLFLVVESPQPTSNKNQQQN
jgi:hypothetical protein